MKPIPLDKQLHFAGGYMIASTLAPISPVVALVAAVVAGLLKEVWDWFHRDKHTPDVWDFIATAVGGLCGTLAYYGVTWAA